ncbi:PREDICTED: putative ferric-chelate reductase 1 [Cyprinodon variegatus]|uniref:putative ferric-chelate reductase 1 n=1 Tax=Cyprinodon variegatus TaxID=28743 RepID=UPI0007427440|nr:PREDICTED: putative ferric-chelate reductase 1 [Cyprinodon variegatus]
MEHTVIQVIATMMVFLTLSFKPVSSQVNITRTGCGSDKFCLEQPTDCDPAGNMTCLFGSVDTTAIKIPNGIDLSFELSGNSSGYIAIGLTPRNAERTLLFICGQNSSANMSFFSTARIFNESTGNLTEAAVGISVTAQNVSMDNIKCVFTVGGLNVTTVGSSARAAEDTSFNVVIGSGSINGGELSNFVSAKTVSVNLANFLSNSTTNTTAAPNGANHPVSSNAVLPLLSFLTLSLLKFA